MCIRDSPYTSSASDLLKAVSALYDRIVDENLLIRRLSISANKLLPEVDVPKDEAEQLDLFTDYAAKEQQEQADEAAHARERKIQELSLIHICTRNYTLALAMLRPMMVKLPRMKAVVSLSGRQMLLQQPF